MKPNAGWPEQVGGRIMYPADAEYFGDYALSFREAGASVVGGCCGTTPQHIAAMKKALDTAPQIDQSHNVVLPQEEITETVQEQPTQFAQKLASGQFAIAVEMDPPRGLSTHKLLAARVPLGRGGRGRHQCCQLLQSARMRMSAWAVCDVVQRKIGVETTLHFPTRGRNLLQSTGRSTCQPMRLGSGTYSS